MAVDAAVEVACVGDNCVDVWVDDNHDRHDGERPHAPRDGWRDRPAAHAGGNAFNVAAALARSGRRAAYFGAVGTDPEAELIVEAATAAGVRLHALRRLPGATGRTVVAHGPGGERRFVSEDYGVAAEYRLGERDLAAIAAARWVHFARQPDMSECLDHLAAHGNAASCDLGLDGGTEQLAQIAQRLDVVFMSESAGGGRSGEQLLSLARDAGARLAVVTLGARGSIAGDRERAWRVPAVPVSDVTDTLGAGDAYIAAFIAARLDDAAVVDAMRAGADAGAAACRRWGLSSPPQADEVSV